MRLTTLSLSTIAVILLSACGGNNNEDASYKVTLTNNTTNQVMAPMVAALHYESVYIFKTGEVASLGLETLAESGSPKVLLEELSSESKFVASGSNGEVIPPNTNATVTIKTTNDQKCISVVSMLTVTNDAFTGVNCVDVSGMETGESKTVQLNTYDAGTEANTESAETVPGGGFGGEGFNEARDDDNNIVTEHAGIKTNTQLPSSVLELKHQWNDPSSTIVIEKMK